MDEKLHGFVPEHEKLIRDTVAKDAANEAEFQRFLHRAWKLQLDPLDGTIHLTVRKKKVWDPEKKVEAWEKTNTIIVGIDGFRAVADINKKLSGIDRGLLRDDKGNLIGAWAEVSRPDWEKPARNEVLLKEYVQTKDGKPTGMWATMPAAMLMKCAEAGAHRMANPALFAGIYAPEEMMQADNEEAKKAAELVKASVPETPAAPGSPPEVKPEEPKPEAAKANPPAGEAPNAGESAPAAEGTGKTETTGKDAPVEPFDGQLITMENVRKVKSYFEIAAFDPIKNVPYILRGKTIPEDLGEKTLIAVTGDKKGDVIKPSKVVIMGGEVKADPKAAGNPAEAPEKAPESTGKYTVTLTSDPKDGTKDFGSGIEKVTWSRANLDGKEVYLIARGDELRAVLQPIKNGAKININGQLEDRNLFFTGLIPAAA